MLCSLRLLASISGLLVAGTLSAQAQSATPAPSHRPALLRVGIGSVLNGAGDYPILKSYLEYAPQFGQHLRLGTRLAFISGSQDFQLGKSYSAPQSYRAVNVEQEAYWAPFGLNRKVELSVGAGVYGGYAKNQSLQTAGFDQNHEFFYQGTTTRGLHVGYLASLNLDVALNQARTWRLGGRVSLQNDNRATILPGGQFTLSRAW